MQKYDAVVLGGGPGGYECAIRLTQNGKKTALVEEAQLGGTCLNRGCIPTKTLLHSADVYYEAKNGAPFGVTAEGVRFDYEKIIQRKNAVSRQLSNGIAFMEKSYGVDVIAARGVLTGPRTLELSNGEVLSAEHIVLATGSVPAVLPIPGVDLPGVVDSTGLLDMTTCPKHIIIVGGDLNGKMQLAHVASAQGVMVADHIAGKPCRELHYQRIPSCVYCSPETAMVGLTEEQARAAGRDVGTGVFSLSGNGKALTMGANEGIVKFVFDRGTDEILGCHILGPRATDLAAEVAAVMECEGTIAEIGSTVHPHPTVSEVLMEAAHVCHGRCVNVPKARK